MAEQNKNNAQTETGYDEEQMDDDQKASSKRKYYMNYRCKERASMSRQKTQAVKAKDRERKWKSSPSTPLPDLPKSPTSYTNLITNLVENTTPRRQSMLRKSGLRLSEERHAVEDTISGVKALTSTLKKKRSKMSQSVKHRLAQTLFALKNRKTQAAILNVSHRAKILQKYQLQPKKHFHLALSKRSMTFTEIQEYLQSVQRRDKKGEV